jgi:predicted DNA-binding transcriptional regulator YafY
MPLSARPVLARMLVIDQSLRACSWPNASTLGKRLEAHPRTIRRDLVYMRDQLHAPIEFDPRRNGYHYTEPSYRLPFLQLTEGELVALFLAEQHLRQYRGTPYGPNLAHAFAKITAGLNEPIEVDGHRLSKAISFRTSAPPMFDVSIIKTLIAAIVRRRRVVIDYWSASRDAESRREVDPYHLMSCDGQYYLIAYCHMRGGIRQFVPGRIRALTLTETIFIPSDTFQVDAYLADSLAVFRGDDSTLHTVRLRFTGAAARFARERLWHPGQTIETTPDGDLLVSFAVSHLREAERLVLSWAPECEALDPPELREQVARALAGALEMHAPRDAHSKGRKRKR